VAAIAEPTARLLERRLPGSLIDGRLPEGAGARILFVGESYATETVLHRLMAPGAARARLGMAALPALVRAFPSFRADADLSMLRVPLAAAPAFATHGLILPQLVDASVALPLPTEPPWPNPHVHRLARKAEAAGFVGSVGQAGELEEFYVRHCVPLARAAHSARAVIEPFERLRRRLEGGALVWIERAGLRVAGAILVHQRPTLLLSKLGLLDGDPALRRQGATIAVDLLALQLAHKGGFARLNMGGSLPFLGDGVLQFKRKFGTMLTRRADLAFVLVLHWHAHGPAVEALLRRLAPIAWVDGHYVALTSGGAAGLARFAIDGLTAVVDVGAIADEGAIRGIPLWSMPAGSSTELLSRIRERLPPPQTGAGLP
jgi:hypothetical protein